MDQPTAGCLLKFMSFFPEAGSHFGIDEAFAREEKHNISSLIEERLPGGEGIFVRHPTRVNPHLGHGVHARIIERLMFHGTRHGFHKILTFFSPSLADYSNDAGHWELIVDRRALCIDSWSPCCRTAPLIQDFSDRRNVVVEQLEAVACNSAAVLSGNPS